MFLGVYERRLVKSQENTYRLFLPARWLKKTRERYPDSFKDVDVYCGNVIIVAPRQVSEETKAKCWRFIESLDPLMQEVTDWKPRDEVT